MIAHNEMINDVAFEWLHDGSIGSFTLHSVHRVAIDYWIDRIIELRQSYPTHKPLLLAHDTSRVTITPYARHRLQELANHPIQHHGRFAVIISNGIIERGITLIINRTLMQVYRDLEEGRCFTSKTEAIRWLAESIRDE